jgi:hypothetical protein
VPALAYSDLRDISRSLLVAAGEPKPEEALPTLWSLRDVDSESKLFLIPDRSL